MKGIETSWRRRLAGFFLAAVCVLTGALDPRAQDSEIRYDDEQVKAAFVLHFARYTDWPKDASVTNGVPLVIGIVNSPKLAASLRKLVDVRGNPDKAVTAIKPPSIVVEIKTDEDADRCQVVYFGQPDKETPALLQRLPRKAVLTVGEGREFIAVGGIIGFAKHGRKIGYFFSAEAMVRSGLRVAPPVVRRAMRIDEPEERQ